MERGALGNAGARSADVKSGRSAERQWKNGPERGALETPGRAPFCVKFLELSGVVIVWNESCLFDG